MNAKYVVFIACSLMMSVAVQAMEIEKPQARIFVWSPDDREYHVLTERGEVSECTLEKSDQERKVSKAQLIIEKNEEGEISKSYVSTATHKHGKYNTSHGSAAYGIYQRTQIPIFFSPEQHTIILDRCRDDKEESILVMYDDSNVYSITGISDNIHEQLEPLNIFGDKSSESSPSSSYAYYRQFATQAMTLVGWAAFFAILIAELNSSTH